TQAPVIEVAFSSATRESTSLRDCSSDVGTYDLNTATVNIVGSDVTGGSACVRTVTRTWNAVDACGNTSSTVSQTITLVDTQAPVIGAAGANATIECTAAPSFTAPDRKSTRMNSSHVEISYAVFGLKK